MASRTTTTCEARGRAGISRVFKKSGMKLDDMAELLHERGYLDNRDMAELEEKLNQAIRGEQVFSRSRPIDEDIEQEMQAEEEEAEAAAAQEEADLTEAADYQQRAIDAGASMDEVEAVFNNTMLGTPEMREAFDELIARQTETAPETETAPDEELEAELNDDLDFNPDELEQDQEETATTPEPLTEEEKLELARGLNRIKAESARVRRDPTQSNIERLESIWSDVQRLNSFHKYSQLEVQRTLQLEDDIESLLEESIEQAAEETVQYGSPPAITPETTREIDALATRVLPPGVGVDIVQDIFDMSGKPAKGRYSQNIIQVAADGTATIDTFNHETIHALRDANLFTPKEWAALVKEADVGKWLDHYGIAQREATYAEGLYQDGNPTDAAYEEAIADAYRDWVRTGELPPGPHRSTLQRVFARITEFFRDIGRYLMRQDTPVNPASVFEHVASGQVGSRGYYRSYAATQAGIPVAQRSIAPQLPPELAAERGKKKGEFDALGQEDLFNFTPSLFPDEDVKPIPGMDKLLGKVEPEPEPESDLKMTPEAEAFIELDQRLNRAMRLARDPNRTPATVNMLADIWQEMQFHPGGKDVLGKDYEEVMDLTRKMVLDLINPPAKPSTAPETTGAQVDIVTEYMAKTPTQTVTSASEAAAASSLIARHAQESFMGIVTDKDGKLLGILKNATGGINMSVIYPSLLAGGIHQIPGAAKVWATHNHPSSSITLSPDDMRTNSQLTEMFDGTDIEYQGFLAVPAGKKKAGFVLPTYETGETIEVEIPQGEATQEVPVFVRAFSEVPRTDKVPPLHEPHRCKPIRSRALQGRRQARLDPD